MTELDPELKGRVLEFIWNTGWVDQRHVITGFFPDDPATARRYLGRLAEEGEIRDSVNAQGQIKWCPHAEPTAGPIIPIRWRQYLDGKTHTFTGDEIREKYGISIPQFRRRLVFASIVRSGRLSSTVENDAIQFRVEDASQVARKRTRSKPMSHVHCGHPITRTDRLACERARKKRQRG